MTRKLAWLAVVALVVAPVIYFAVSLVAAPSACAADPAPAMQPAPNPAPAPATQPANAPAAPATEPSKEDQTKKTDKTLGVDWGDKPAEKKDATDAADSGQPAQKVDLTTALDKAQTAQLEMIKKKADKAEELSKKAQDALDGKTPGLKPADAMGMFNNAATQYSSAQKDAETLAKGIKDADTKLTVLRDYADAYKAKAADIYAKLVKYCVDNAKTVADLRMAAMYLNKLRQVDPKYADLDGLKSSIETAFTTMQQAAAAKTDTSNNGGGKKPDDPNAPGWHPTDYTGHSTRGWTR